MNLPVHDEAEFFQTLNRKTLLFYIDYKALNPADSSWRISIARKINPWLIWGRDFFSTLYATAGYYCTRLFRQNKRRYFHIKGGFMGLKECIWVKERSSDVSAHNGSHFKKDSNKFKAPSSRYNCLFTGSWGAQKNLDILMKIIKIAGVSLNRSKCKLFKSKLKIPA